LYELVTLEPIFPGRNRQELLHQIINDEPRAPSVLEKSIPIELETIILKAVSKNLSDRYNTAQELADDLQRYLEDKPILAKRPSLMERTRKWSRRHPSVVIAGMVILLLCLVGLGINNWMIAQEQAKTQAALQHEKDRAMEARRAVGDLVEIAGSELADQPQLEGLRKRLLRTALAYYGDFIATHGDDPSAQKELAQGKDRAAKLLEELSTLEGKNLLGLSTNPEVQIDIKVDDGQRLKLADLKDRFFEPRMKNFGGHRFGTPESRQREYASVKEQEAALKQILGPKKMERLQQINLQSQGARAFHDSNAVDVLKLTPDQIAKIRDLKYDTRNKLEACAQDSNVAPKEARKEMDQIFKDEMTSIQKLLTPEQTAQWQALTGSAFQGTLHNPPPWGKGRGKDGPPPGRHGGPPPDGPHGPPP
jgi:eukaryotic-like serine/threonine-protein kinase